MASGISLREQHVDVSVDIDGRCLIGLTSLSLDVPTALLNAAQQAGERVRRALEEISGDATAEAAVKEAAASVEASVDTANGAEVSASATTGDRCGASSDVCGRAAEAVSSAAAETEENCERKALRDPLPFAVPLYVRVDSPSVGLRSRDAECTPPCAWPVSSAAALLPHFGMLRRAFPSVVFHRRGRGVPRKGKCRGDAAPVAR